MGASETDCCEFRRAVALVYWAAQVLAMGMVKKQILVVFGGKLSGIIFA